VPAFLTLVLYLGEKLALRSGHFILMESAHVQHSVRGCGSS